MTNISSLLRNAIVCGGFPSSQRKLFGFANQTCPDEVSGCVSDLNVRVCVKSADHVWMFVCAANHETREEFVCSPRIDCPLNTRKSAKTKNIFPPVWRISRAKKP